MRRAFYVKSIIFIILVTAIFCSQFFWDAASYFEPDRISNWLEGAGNLAPFLYMAVMASAVVISPIPSLPLDIAAGAFFGPVMGTVYSVSGALIGAVISFMIARLLGRELVERYLGGHVNFCESCSDKFLTKMVFISRLIPVVSFDVVSYGAGLTKMSLRKFSIASFLGMVPLTFIYNYSGSVMVFGRGTAFFFGVFIVTLFFILPKWLEGKDFMNGINHK